MSLSRQNGHSNTHSSSGGLRVRNTKGKGVKNGGLESAGEVLKRFEVMRFVSKTSYRSAIITLSDVEDAQPLRDPEI